MNNKVVVTAALVGNGTTKQMNPNTPYTAEELARDAVLCARAGAAIVHVHVRDSEGKPSTSLQLYRDAYHAIEDALDAAGLDAIINLTTSGRTTDEERMAAIADLKPEMCSYNPGSINWGNRVYNNPPSYMMALGKLCQETGTKPEIEIFDTAMLTAVRDMVAGGYLTDPCHFQFIMEIPSGMKATLLNIGFLQNYLPEGATWSITGCGRSHMAAMLAGLAGGATGIRTGLEDAVWLYKGVPATNESFVKQAVDLVKLAGKEVATAEEARQIIGVKHRK